MGGKYDARDGRAAPLPGYLGARGNNAPANEDATHRFSATADTRVFGFLFLTF